MIGFSFILKNLLRNEKTLKFPLSSRFYLHEQQRYKQIDNLGYENSQTTIWERSIFVVVGRTHGDKIVWHEIERKV